MQVEVVTDLRRRALGTYTGAGEFLGTCPTSPSPGVQVGHSGDTPRLPSAQRLWNPVLRAQTFGGQFGRICDGFSTAHPELSGAFLVTRPRESPAHSERQGHGFNAALFEATKPSAEAWSEGKRTFQNTGNGCRGRDEAVAGTGVGSGLGEGGKAAHRVPDRPPGPENPEKVPEHACRVGVHHPGGGGCALGVNRNFLSRASESDI